MSSDGYPDPLAVAVMVAYCGWDPTVPVADTTATLDGNGSNLAALPSLYVTDVSAVTVTNWDGSTCTPTIGPSGQVAWSSNGLLAWVGFGCWPEGLGNISVTYSGGYDGPPEDLEAALNSLSGRITQVQSGLTGAKLLTASFSYAATVAAGGLLLVEQMVFDSYRLPRVA